MNTLLNGIIAVFLFLCSITSNPACSATLPDRKYFKEVKSIDSLVSVEKIRDYKAHTAQLNSAVNRLVALGTEYRLTIQEVFILTNLSLIVGHPKGLELGVRQQVLAGAGSPEKVMNSSKLFIKEVYKIDVDKDIQPTTAMNQAVANLIRDGDKLKSAARQKLDLDAIALIMELFTRDDQVRSIESYVFKDSSGFDFRSPQYPTNVRYPMGRWIAYEMADSVNLSKLYNYLQTNPFPGQTVAGVWSGRLWMMLRHCSGLLQCQDKANLDKYLKQWKYILPIAYRSSLNGEFYASSYAYVHYSLMEMTKTNIAAEDLAFFKQYAPEEPYEGRR